jgi:tetrahydromethanopterin S-methyltransferase subunit D
MKFSPIAFFIPLMVAMFAVAGVFVYKSMLAPSKAAEEVDMTPIAKQRMKLPVTQPKRTGAGFGESQSQAVSSGLPSAPVGTQGGTLTNPNQSLTGQLDAITAATTTSELQDLQKDVNSL